MQPSTTESRPVSDASPQSEKRASPTTGWVLLVCGWIGLSAAFVLLVEKNPNALVAVFNVTPEVEAKFATRSKMGETSDVYAIAVTKDGKALFSKKEVKVTLGGCGG